MSSEIKAASSPAHQRHEVFEAFAGGVAAVIGKACWERLEHDVIRRSNLAHLSAAVIADPSGVSRKMNTGKMEFHRLIYVLATYEKNFASLPDQFPPRSALKLNGTRHLAYLQRRMSATTASIMKPEAIVEQFPLWSFFVANEMAMNLTRWVALLRQKRDPRATDAQRERHENELAVAIVECEENAGSAMTTYADSLRPAFGSRYEDAELQKARRPLKADDMQDMLKWAENILDADAILENWMKNLDDKVHLIWQEST